MALAALVGVLAAAGASAQDNDVIGPPQLKDFQLPGQRTSPPRPVGPVDDGAVPTTAAPPIRQAPPPAAVASPSVRPPATSIAPPSTQPAAPRAAEPAAPRREAPAPAPSSDSATPRTDAPVNLPTTPTPAFTPSTEPAQPLTAPETGADEGAGSAWSPLWLALPILLAAIAGLAFWRRRRSADEAYAQDHVAAPSGLVAKPQHGVWTDVVPAATPLAGPLQARLGEPVAAAAEAAERAWLEVEFKPSRAAATDKETIVHYELVLRNVGKAPAGNIRIDSRLFNAGAEGDIKAFLGGAIHEHSGSPHVMIAPDDELRLGSTIAMPKEDVREIVIDGRSLFVPAVAVNVAYNWGDLGAGAGRTSKSWLVGREAEQPSQKMGAFRLDLGPRIYRSVGQRQTGLAQMV